MKARMSLHARFRAVSRSELSEDAIEQILDNDLLHVVIYKELRKRRRKGLPRRRVILHKLFFAWVDNGWRIAIQDSSNGEIITIQEPWYYYRQHRLLPELFLRAFAATPLQLPAT